MASLATVAELGARLVPAATPTGADATRAQAVLDDVSAVARKLSGDSDRWPSSTPADVKAIVLAAARRLYLNPNGFASEQDGDYSYRIDSDSLAAGGGMFTGAETDLLQSYADTSELWSLKVCGSAEQTRLTGNLLADIQAATFPGGYP